MQTKYILARNKPSKGCKEFASNWFLNPPKLRMSGFYFKGKTSQLTLMLHQVYRSYFQILLYSQRVAIAGSAAYLI